MTNDQILEKLALLENHIINLIIPIQSIGNILKSPNDIQTLINLLNRPIRIEEGKFIDMLSEFKQYAEEFKQDIKELGKLELSNTFNEIKYIGKRLNEIENKLGKICKDGIDKHVKVDLTLDGYPMVKKTIYHEEDDPVEYPCEAMESLLKTLKDEEKWAIIYRCGLHNENRCTYEKLGKILGVTRERARQIYIKAIRKCRHPSRSKFVEKINHPKLFKEIMGDSKENYLKGNR